MIILLCLLKNSTSQENKNNKTTYTHNKTISNVEPCILNSSPSLFDTVNGFKKRFKPIDSILDTYEEFDLLFNDLNNHKSSKTIPEWDLDTGFFGHDPFLELESNDTINEGCTEISRELDSSNSSNINNENITRINIPDVQKENTLSHQQHSGILITEFKKNLEIRQVQSPKDQLEITNFNKYIMIDFVSNIKQLKNKKIGTILNIEHYIYTKESVSLLYSYLLKGRVANMGNLSLLKILISEIEYNNEVMIYCFLASKTYKILEFIIKKINESEINPIFFYNVGLFMEKYWPGGCFGGCFPIPWETGGGTRKYAVLGGFIKAYKSLEVHNEMNLPDIFDGINIERCFQTQLEIIALYNLVKEAYNQFLNSKKDNKVKI